MSDQTSQDRTPAGVPTGGQFAASAKGEATAVTLDDPAVPLADIVPASGVLTIGEEDFDGYYDFESIDLSRNDDGTFALSANSSTDVQYGLVLAYLSETGGNPDDADDVVEADKVVNAWLARNSEAAIAYFEDETGSRLHREFEWDNQRFSWDTSVAADAQSDVVFEAADDAVRTHPDNADAFYRSMWRDAEGYLKRRKPQA